MLLALTAPGRAKAQARKIALGDLQKIVGVSNPEIAPDGNSMVIVVSRVNWDEDRHDSQLVLVDIATGARILPRGRLLLPRAWRSISRGREGALRREALAVGPTDVRTVDGSSRDSPKHDSTGCDRNRWCARPTENTDAPIQTGKIPR